MRTVLINGEIHFVGKDVATALGYAEGKSLANAIANHVDDDDKGVTEMMTPGSYFRTIEQKWERPEGDIMISIKTLVYQQGVEYIRQLLTKLGYKPHKKEE